jgi:hypothetical protein
MDIQNLMTNFGWPGLILGAIFIVLKLLISKGYRFKIDVGPDPSAKK